MGASYIYGYARVSTQTPQGRLMLAVFQAFSQFERDLIAQRTKEGLESARARGRKGGRPKIKDSRIAKALKLYDSKEYSISEITRSIYPQESAEWLKAARPR